MTLRTLALCMVVVAALTVLVILAPWLAFGLGPSEFAWVLGEPEGAEMFGYVACLTLLAVGLMAAGWFKKVDWAPRLAALCVLVGLSVAAWLVGNAEFGFQQAFTDDGASGGWRPWEARANFLVIFYWAGLAQVWAGLLCAGALLIYVRRLTRPAQP